MASNRFGGQKFRPPHLYQLFAYLKNVEVKDALSQRAEGILLYPTAGPSTSYDFRMEGHMMRICSVNLMQDWRMIKKDLLALI
jgi:5-methylcytosine-specific restriction enzyme subunit McrC